MRGGLISSSGEKVMCDIEGIGEGTGVTERDEARVALDSDLTRMEGFGGNRVDSTLLRLSVKDDDEVEVVVLVGVSIVI